MTCTFTVAQPTGYRVDETSNVPVTIHVEGTVENCESNKILVELGCMKPGKIIDIPQGTTDWSVDFEMPSAHTCLCRRRIVVTVYCVTEDGSNPFQEDFVFASLECETLRCPIIQNVSINIGDCNDSGQRAVTFGAEIIPADTNPVWTQFNFGDGTYSAATDDLDPSATHYYDIPGPYTAKLEIIIPEGCPRPEIEIPVLEPCPVECPEAMIDDIVATVAGDCNDDYTRDVTLTPILNAFANPVQKYRWEFSGGIATIEIPGSENPGITIQFPAPGNTEVEYTITFAVLRPDGCIDIKTKLVTVPGCQGKCPKIEKIDVIVNPCDPSESLTRRSMTLDAEISGGSPSKYIWDFGDGDSENIDASSEDPRTTHEYNAPGHYTVTLTIEGPDQCRDSKQIEIDVPRCPGRGIRGCTDPNALNYNPDATIDDGTCKYNNGNNGNGTRWGSLCCWLIYAWLIVFISIWFTTEYWPALVSALGTAMALLIVWYFKCCCGKKFWKKEFWKCVNPFKNCVFLRWTILGHLLALLFLGWAISFGLYTPPGWVWGALTSGLAFWGWRFHAAGCDNRPVTFVLSTWPPCKCKNKK